MIGLPAFFSAYLIYAVIIYNPNFFLIRRQKRLANTVIFFQILIYSLKKGKVIVKLPILYLDNNYITQ